MAPLLRDPAAQEHFESHGFVVTRLLSPPQVALLLGVYDRFIGESGVSGLYESSRHNPYEANRLINQAIHDQIALSAPDIFLPSRIYGGTFMVKSHRDSDVLPLHQDWSVVDEAQHSTLFVWCPLVDVSRLNGGLFVLPGSHRWFETLRSGSYPSNRYVLPPQLHRHVRDIPLLAGEAVLYSDALFHGSHANNGPQDRIVATARVTEREAPLVYFHRASDDETDIFEATPQFYLTHIDSLAKGLMPPAVPRIGRRPYRHVPITTDALEAKVRQHCDVPGGIAQPVKQLFMNAALQREFERNGFAVIDLIDERQVGELRAFYAGLENAAAPRGGFQVSLDNENPEFVRRVSQKLVETVGPSVGAHLTGHQIFTASFVTKQKDPFGVVPPHQDWTFVDESQFWSATIWCPLVDVTADNGALALLKGSHLFYDHVRPSPSPQYSPPFADQLPSIFPYMQVLNLRAGQAVVFNNQTLHASPPNTMEETRLAFGIGVTHRDARIRHYYMLPGQPQPLIEGYEVGPEFFSSYNNARLSAMYGRGEKPRGLNSIGTFAVRSRHYDTEQLVAKMRAAGNVEDPALSQRVAAWSGPAAHGAHGADGHRGAGAAAPQASGKRPLWKVYTPGNIVREIQFRLRKS